MVRIVKTSSATANPQEPKVVLGQPLDTDLKRLPVGLIDERLDWVHILTLDTCEVESLNVTKTGPTGGLWRVESDFYHPPEEYQQAIKQRDKQAQRDGIAASSTGGSTDSASDSSKLLSSKPEMKIATENSRLGANLQNPSNSKLGCLPSNSLADRKEADLQSVAPDDPNPINPLKSAPCSTKVSDETSSVAGVCTINSSVVVEPELTDTLPTSCHRTESQNLADVGKIENITPTETTNTDIKCVEEESTASLTADTKVSMNGENIGESKVVASQLLVENKNISNAESGMGIAESCADTLSLHTRRRTHINRSAEKLDGDTMGCTVVEESSTEPLEEADMSKATCNTLSNDLTIEPTKATSGIAEIGGKMAAQEDVSIVQQDKQAIALSGNSGKCSDVKPGSSGECPDVQLGNFQECPDVKPTNTGNDVQPVPSAVTNAPKMAAIIKTYGNRKQELPQTFLTPESYQETFQLPKPGSASSLAKPDRLPVSSEEQNKNLDTWLTNVLSKRMITIEAFLELHLPKQIDIEDYELLSMKLREQFWKSKADSASKTVKQNSHIQPNIRTHHGQLQNSIPSKNKIDAPSKRPASSASNSSDDATTNKGDSAATFELFSGKTYVSAKMPNSKRTCTNPFPKHQKKTEGTCKGFIPQSKPKLKEPVEFAPYQFKGLSNSRLDNTIPLAKPDGSKLKDNFALKPILPAPPTSSTPTLSLEHATLKQLDSIMDFSPIRKDAQQRIQASPSGLPSSALARISAGGGPSITMDFSSRPDLHANVTTNKFSQSVRYATISNNPSSQYGSAATVTSSTSTPIVVRKLDTSETSYISTPHIVRSSDILVTSRMPTPHIVPKSDVPSQRVAQGDDGVGTVVSQRPGIQIKYVNSLLNTVQGRVAEPSAYSLNAQVGNLASQLIETRDGPMRVYKFKSPTSQPNTPLQHQPWNTLTLQSQVPNIDNSEIPDVKPVRTDYTARKRKRLVTTHAEGSQSYVIRQPVIRISRLPVFVYEAACRNSLRIRDSAKSPPRVEQRKRRVIDIDSSSEDETPVKKSRGEATYKACSINDLLDSSLKRSRASSSDSDSEWTPDPEDMKRVQPREKMFPLLSNLMSNSNQQTKTRESQRKPPAKLDIRNKSPRNSPSKYRTLVPKVATHEAPNEERLKNANAILKALLPTGVPVKPGNLYDASATTSGDAGASGVATILQRTASVTAQELESASRSKTVSAGSPKTLQMKRDCNAKVTRSNQQANSHSSANLISVASKISASSAPAIVTNSKSLKVTPISLLQRLVSTRISAQNSSPTPKVKTANSNAKPAASQSHSLMSKSRSAAGVLAKRAKNKAPKHKPGRLIPSTNMQSAPKSGVYHLSRANSTPADTALSPGEDINDDDIIILDDLPNSKSSSVSTSCAVLSLENL